MEPEEFAGEIEEVESMVQELLVVAVALWTYKITSICVKDMLCLE